MSWKVFFEKRGQNEFTKILVKADLDFLHRELFVRGLGFAVALSVLWKIDFACVYTGGPIQLYTIHTREGRCIHRIVRAMASEQSTTKQKG